MDLQDYLRIIRKRWMVIALTTLIVIGLTGLYTALATKHYASTTQFFVSVSGADDGTQLQQGSTFVQQRVTSYAQLMTTPRALNPVVAELDDGTTVKDVAEMLTTETPADTVLLGVTVTDPSAERAQQIATVIGETFPAVVDEIERPSDDSKKSPVRVSLVRPAESSTSPVSPRPFQNLALAALLGLLLGFALAVLRHLSDTTVRTNDDVEEVTEEPIIGGVHYDPRAAQEPLIVETDPSSPRAEAFRALRTNLMFVNAASHPRTIALTSSIPGEGKSTTIANLALTLAQSGSRVCLIEGDLRRPRLLQYLGLEGSAGITDVLIERAELEDVLQPYGEHGLDILGAGSIPPNPSELLASPAMSRVLSELANSYDYVLIDTPPILPVTDAVILSTKVDGVIVLVGTTIVRKEQLDASMEALGAVQNNVLGLVLNRVGTKGGDAGGYYGYYDYQSDVIDDTRSKRSSRPDDRRRSRRS